MGIDPEALGLKVGNIINGLPEIVTSEDLEVAKEAARLGLLEQMTTFDETVVPEEVVWGIPGAVGSGNYVPQIIRGEE